jgi:sensor histidine kinase YesM
MLAWFPRPKSFRIAGLLVTAGSLIGIALFYFMYYSQHGQLPDVVEKADKMLLAAVITCVVGALLLQVDRLLDKGLHWKDHFIARLVSGLLSHLILTSSVLLLLNVSLLTISNEELLKLLILFTILLFIYEIVYGLLYSYRYYAITQAEQLRTERWQLELQFQSLKSQISPHYLFNCLNTVSALLYKDTREAEEFIRRMADTFRYVLTHERQQLVTLQEELEFTKAYYFLLQVRYEYLLQLEINIPSNLLNTFVPPMTLQLLVENAVKHNRISKETPLLVYISATDNTRIIVSNTKTGATNTSGFRVGLDNIHTRYKFFSLQPVLVRDEERFTVQLPVLKINQLLAAE